MKRAILVKSCQRFRLRRVACEETWVRDIRAAGVTAWTIEGGHAPTVITDTQIKLRGGDAYTDNSAKLHAALKHLTETATEFDCLFICDDDTFVHPQRWLAHEPQGEMEGRIFHPRTARHMKQNEGRPWISGGSGWWMSRRLCQLYVDQVTECCSWDDVLAARVAQQNGIEIVDRPDLYGADRYSGCDPPERVSADNSLITCHHVQPAEMVKLWEALSCSQQ